MANDQCIGEGHHARSGYPQRPRTGHRSKL